MVFEAHTPGIDLIVFRDHPGWIISYHRLFDISPARAPAAIVIGAPISIWVLCFSEDLLQAVNKQQGLILDVGWYPEADPEGSYKMRVIRFDTHDQDNPDSYDWGNPLVTMTTRSLEELLMSINHFMETNS